jgi:thioredoxin-dependent peroxiredoxin
MTHLQEGNPAPPFSASDQDGKTISLSDFREKVLALVFYSEDGSPTCTLQACNLRDNYASLLANHIALLAVSPDSEKKHKKFEAKYKLPYRMIADSDKKILEQYGLWSEKELFGRKYMGVHRTTFIIDKNGIIRKIFTKPVNKAHAQEIIEAVKDL